MDQHVYLNLITEIQVLKKLDCKGVISSNSPTTPSTLLGLRPTRNNNIISTMLVRKWMIYNVGPQLHTPPHLPDVNPIEHLWAKLKRRIKKHGIINTKNWKIVHENSGRRHSKACIQASKKAWCYYKSKWQLHKIFKKMLYFFTFEKSFFFDDFHFILSRQRSLILSWKLLLVKFK